MRFFFRCLCLISSRLNLFSFRRFSSCFINRCTKKKENSIVGNVCVMRADHLMQWVNGMNDLPIDTTNTDYTIPMQYDIVRLKLLIETKHSQNEYLAKRQKTPTHNTVKHIYLEQFTISWDLFFIKWIIDHLQIYMISSTKRAPTTQRKNEHKPVEKSRDSFDVELNSNWQLSSFWTKLNAYQTFHISVFFYYFTWYSFFFLVFFCWIFIN